MKKVWIKIIDKTFFLKKDEYHFEEAELLGSNTYWETDEDGRGLVTTYIVKKKNGEIIDVGIIFTDAEN